MLMQKRYNTSPSPWRWRVPVLAVLLAGFFALTLLAPPPQARAASIPVPQPPLHCLTQLFNKYTGSTDAWSNLADGAFDRRNDCGVPVSYGTVTVGTSLFGAPGSPCPQANATDTRGFGLAPGHTLAGDLGKGAGGLTYHVWGNCTGCDCHGLPTEWFPFQMYSTVWASARAIVNGKARVVDDNPPQLMVGTPLAIASFSNGFGDGGGCWGTVGVTFTY